MRGKSFCKPKAQRGVTLQLSIDGRSAKAFGPELEAARLRCHEEPVSQRLRTALHEGVSEESIREACLAASCTMPEKRDEVS